MILTLRLRKYMWILVCVFSKASAILIILWDNAKEFVLVLEFIYLIKWNNIQDNTYFITCYMLKGISIFDDFLWLWVRTIRYVSGIFCFARNTTHFNVAMHEVHSTNKLLMKKKKWCSDKRAKFQLNKTQDNFSWSSFRWPCVFLTFTYALLLVKFHNLRVGEANVCEPISLLHHRCISCPCKRPETQTFPEPLADGSPG